MTRPSERELRNDVEQLDASGGDDDPLGDVTVSYEQPDDWEPDDDATVVDFTDVDT
jgi:hypothetical protein